MWIKASYVFLALVSFGISQLPIYLASVDSAQSSFCDTDAWFEFGKCMLDPQAAIVGSGLVFFITYALFIALFEVVRYALSLRRNKRFPSVPI